MDLKTGPYLFIDVIVLLSIMQYMSAQPMDNRQGTDGMVVRQRSRIQVQDRPFRQQSGMNGQRRTSVPNRNTVNMRNRQISGVQRFPNSRGVSRVQIDPRIIDQRRIAFIRMRRQPTSRPPNARSSMGTTTSSCPAPRSVRCYIWPNNRDTSTAFRCEGRCRGRSCILPCECSCVHPRLIAPLRTMGRIRGPELRPLDTRLRQRSRQDQNTNTPLAIRRALQRRLGGAQRGIQSDARSRRPTVPFNFGISDDVIATLIAQPILNEIVGPQGINQIIAGEPPQILSREAMTRGTNPRNQPDLRSGMSSIQRPTSPVLENAGIPVPISQLNLFPGQSVRSTDLLPTPTDVSLLSTPGNDVNVQQLPGTNVLFVNLSRSGPSANTRSVAERLKTVSPMVGSHSHSHDVINSTLMSRDTGLVTGLDGNNFIQDPSLPSRFSPPTKAECLTLNLELWCDPQPQWDGTPGVSRWCLLNCRADNCDNQRCACSCIEEILFTAKFDQLTLQQVK